MNCSFVRHTSRGIALVLPVLCLVLFSGSDASAARRSKRPIAKPQYDPAAERVELFKGMKEGLFEAKIIPQDSRHGNVLIENKSDKPLTVQMPEAFVGVQVLPQVGGIGGGGGMGMGGMGMGGMGGGQQQALGGGMGGMGMGGMGMGGMGGLGGGAGFFSIPAESVITLPFQSVCLEHGKPDPTSRSTYRIMKLEDATKNVALRELIRMVGTNRIHPQVAQAAAWHLTDDMSWRELAAKRVERLGGQASRPYFNRAALYHAQQLVAQAVAASRDENKDAKPVAPRTRTLRTYRRTR